jgi:hypothetical protein
MAAVAQRPSVPLGKLRVNQVSPAPGQFPVWLTGRQCPGTKHAIRVCNGSVPRVAHRPSVTHAGAVCCPASRASFAADAGPSLLQLTSEPLRPRFILTSGSFPATGPPPPLDLQVTPLILAGSRPATIHQVRKTLLLLVMIVPALAGLRLKAKFASKKLPDEPDDQPFSGLEPRLPRPCCIGSPGLTPITARGPGARPPTIRPSPLSTPADTDPDPGQHLRLWEATSLANVAIESKSDELRPRCVPLLVVSKRVLASLVPLLLEVTR